MSLWIESPEIVDTESGQVLLTFHDANWSLDSARWLDDCIVMLTLRKYPGDHLPAALEAKVDCVRRVAQVGTASPCPWTELESQLEDSLSWNKPKEQAARAGLSWFFKLFRR